MNEKSKIYVIGNVHRNYNTIIKISKLLKELYPFCTIRNVEKFKDGEDCMPRFNLQTLISKSYKNIQWCDVLIAITNDTGDLGEGVMYEVEFAKTLEKKIILV